MEIFASDEPFSGKRECLSGARHWFNCKHRKMSLRFYTRSRSGDRQQAIGYTWSRSEDHGSKKWCAEIPNPSGVQIPALLVGVLPLLQVSLLAELGISVPHPAWWSIKSVLCICTSWYISDAGNTIQTSHFSPNPQFETMYIRSQT